MIVKIKSWKRPEFRKLIAYMIHDKDRLTGEDGRGFLLLHNIKGNSIDAWVKQLQENEKYRKHKRSNSNYITHEILSWHRDDSSQITPEKLAAMTREYMRLRNNNGMFLAVPHYDKTHYHIHILASGVEYRTGKAMRMSRGELAALKKNIQQYQQERFPELSKSVVEHGRKGKEIAEKGQGNKLSKRAQVMALIAECRKASKSDKEFYARLKEKGLQTYVRGGRVYGVVVNGRRHRFKWFRFQNL